MDVESLKRTILDTNGNEYLTSEITESIIENYEALAPMFPFGKYKSLIQFLDENHTILPHYSILFDGGIERFSYLFDHVGDSSRLLVQALFQQDGWSEKNDELLSRLVRSCRAFSLSRPKISTAEYSNAKQDISEAAKNTRLECQYLYWQKWLEYERPIVLYESEFIQLVHNQRLKSMVYMCLTTLIHEPDRIHCLVRLDMFGVFKDIPRTWELRMEPEARFVDTFLKGDLNGLRSFIEDLESSRAWRHPNIMPYLIYNVLDNPEMVRELHDVVMDSLSNNKIASKYFTTWYYRECQKPSTRETPVSSVYCTIEIGPKYYRPPFAAHIESIIYQKLVDVEDAVDLCANNHLAVEILRSCPQEYFEKIIKVFSVESIEREFRSFYFYGEPFKCISSTRRRALLRLGVLINAFKKNHQIYRAKSVHKSLAEDGDENIDIVMLWVSQEYFPDMYRVIKALIDRQIPKVALQKVYDVGDSMFPEPIMMPEILKYLQDYKGDASIEWLKILPESEYEGSILVQNYIQHILWNRAKNGDLNVDFLPTYLLHEMQNL